VRIERMMREFPTACVPPARLNDRCGVVGHVLDQVGLRNDLRLASEWLGCGQR